MGFWGCGRGNIATTMRPSPALPHSIDPGSAARCMRCFSRTKTHLPLHFFLPPPKLHSPPSSQCPCGSTLQPTAPFHSENRHRSEPWSARQQARQLLVMGTRKFEPNANVNRGHKFYYSSSPPLPTPATPRPNFSAGLGRVSKTTPKKKKKSVTK